MTPIRLGIVEDQADMLQDTVDKLKPFPNIVVALQATDGHDLLKKLEEGKEMPDVLLMDIEMPNMNGIEATRKVKKQYPSLQIVMLSVFADDEKLFEALKAGASGYLLKDIPPSKLNEALKQANEGGIPFSPQMADRVQQYFRNIHEKPKSELDEAILEGYGLTDREINILKELEKGLGVKYISEKLTISEKTVSKHLSNIYTKLQVHSRIEALNKGRGKNI